MFVELPTAGFQKLLQRVPDFHIASKGTKQSRSSADHAHILNLLFPDTSDNFPVGGHDGESSRPFSTVESEPGGEDTDQDHPRPDIRVIISQEGTVAAAPKVLFDSRLPHRSGGTTPGTPSNLQHRRTRSGQDSAQNVTSQFPRRSSVSSIRGHRDYEDLLRVRKPRAQDPSSGGPLPKAPTLSFLDNLRSSQNDRERGDGDGADDIVECVFGSSGLPSAPSTKFHVRPFQGNAGRPQVPPAGPQSNRHERSKSYSSGRSSSISFADPRPTYNTSGRHAPASAESLTLLVSRIFMMDAAEPNHARAESQHLESTSGAEVFVDDTQSLTDGKRFPHGEKSVYHKVPHFAITLVLYIPVSPVPDEPSALHPEHAFTNDGYGSYDHGIHCVMGRWANLMRALRSLEALLSSVFRERLRHSHTETEGHLSRNAGLAVNDTFSDGKTRLRRSDQRSFHLATASLSEDKTIHSTTMSIIQNLRAAFGIRRVTSGSKKWEAWRAETRLLFSLFGGKSQNFFLFNILTAFLGNHLSWVEALAPKWLKQAKRVNNVTSHLEDVIVDRTVVVCSDGDVGRQFIYILASFILTRRGIDDHPRHHSTSPRSHLSLSQSPPFLAHAARETSLRRSIGRRTGAGILTEAKAMVSANPSESSTVGSLGAYRHQQYGRRLSNARSTRSLAIPVPQADSILRKSSAGVVSATVPIRQVSTFAAPSQRGTSAEPRPGSSGSLAALSLQRTLSRSDSSTLESPTSPSHSRWGSVMSGFWSLGRRSSTEQSEPAGSFDDGLGISGLRRTLPETPQLSMMADDDHPASPHQHITIATLDGPLGPTGIAPASHPLSSTPARDIPLPAKSDEHALKFSVDEVDGVVDIELEPDRSYSSSVDSSTTNTAASSFNDHISLYGRRPARPRPHPPSPGLLDVAGFLHEYHPDFTLQAVRPSWTVKRDVIRSLRDEASQYPGSPRAFSALLADADAFRVVRLTLDHDQIREEPIMDLDPTFVDAVEHLLQPRHEAPTEPECRKVIWSALETVVKSVIAEDDGGDARADPDENILREGIRRWIRERGAAR